jgi:hypothetical protein
LKEPLEAASGSGKGNQDTKAWQVGFELAGAGRAKAQGFAYMWKVGDWAALKKKPLTAKVAKEGRNGR